MRIQHNITAMNSYRNYTNNNSKLGRNLEKLSSGYAINRAGDDAAGLAISEKMRAQVTGIEVASKNAKDGISVVQTAEGALTEVHDMLNRMFALAEQANNGIYQKEEREKLQSEIDQLTTEIDRIGDSTNFNGMKLLDGTLSEAPIPARTVEKGTTSAGVSGPLFKWSASSSQTVKADFNKAISTAGTKITVTTIYTAGRSATSAVAGRSAAAAYVSWVSGGTTYTAADTATALGSGYVSGTHGPLGVHASVTAITPVAALSKIDAVYELDVDLSAITALTNYTIKNATIATSDVKTNDEKTYGIINNDKQLKLKLNETERKGTTISITLQDANKVEVGTVSFDYGPVKPVDLAYSATPVEGTNKISYSDKVVLTDQTDPNSAVSQGALNLQIGDSTNAYDQMGISVDSMKAASLNIEGLDIIKSPTDAMGRIKGAIESVSVQRGSLGAYQNRLEHTINNLSVMRENIQDAEATIRDTDMAEEMMKYTKNNILVQSAQAMLAQANQLPQGVLSLLQ